MRSLVCGVLIIKDWKSELCLDCRVYLLRLSPETKPKYYVTNAGVCSVHRENKVVLRSTLAPFVERRKKKTLFRANFQ